MRHPLAAYLTAVLALVLLGPAVAAQAEPALPANFELQTLADGLDLPVAVAWAPDGRMFVAEKDGRLRVVSSTGQLRAEPVLDIRDQVNSYLDRGLLGVAVDPDYASNHFVYVVYVAEDPTAPPDEGGPMTSRLVRYQIGLDSREEGTRKVLLGADGARGVCGAAGVGPDCLPADAASHSIGTVRAAPDGTIWMANGDATEYGGANQAAFRTYDETSFAGKLINVDREGNGLARNPFCSGRPLTEVCTKIAAKGFRNPFRFSLDGGDVWIGDVGWGDYEEINRLTPGRNYGWPCWEGPQRTPGYIPLDCNGVTDVEPPYYYYPHNGNTGSVTGGPVYRGNQYPAGYAGALFFGDYSLQTLSYLPTGRAPGSPAVPFASGVSPVDIERDPGGDLVIVELGENYGPGEGTVKRIVYSPGNARPVARLDADVDAGRAPLPVRFDGSRSSDPDADRITYSWDFGDGSAPSTLPSPRHTFDSTGAYTVTLTVDDGRGRSATARKVIQVGAPDVVIEQPVAGSRYSAGTPVPLAATARDQAGDPVPVTWSILLRHNTHTHVVGTPGSSFTPLRDHDTDSFYDITATAESNGLKAQAKVTIYPRAATVSLRSEPAGVPVSWGQNAPAATPSDREAGVGFLTSVAAPPSWVAPDGRMYDFRSWSDGGGLSHPFTVPDGPITLTARYARREAPQTPQPPAPPADPLIPDAPVVKPPGLSVDTGRLAARAARRTGLLQGRLSGAAGLTRLDLSLTRRLPGGRCAVWSPRLDQLSRRTMACSARRWAPARVGRKRDWWRLQLGAALPSGRYTLTGRIRTGGRWVPVSAGFRL